MALTDAKLRSLKGSDKIQKISDGGGLHVVVTPTGSRLWRLAYRFGGKQKHLALGKYPDVSLWGMRPSSKSRIASPAMIHSQHKGG